MNDPGTEKRGGWKTVGLVGAACVACCAGPLLVAVGGIGALGSAVAFVVWPVAGLAVAVTTIATVVYLHRRRTRSAGTEPVTVELSSRPREGSSASERR
ncbi:MAG: hypothetical protein ACRDZV_17385 [Acidimicrobiia bacterium]